MSSRGIYTTGGGITLSSRYCANTRRCNINTILNALEDPRRIRRKFFSGLLNNVPFIFNIKYLLHTSIYTIRSIFRHVTDDI